MSSTQNWFVHDHSQHEENLASCRQAIEKQDWDKANSIFGEFVKALKSHITQEEEEVFPIYDALVKISHDPIRLLRAEHDRIISFLKDMQQFIKDHDPERGLECIRQLEDEISKHEEKEEEIFLPMAGYVLDDKYWEAKGKANSTGEIASGRNWDF